MKDALTLKPWTRVAQPHADIRAGIFDMSTYAANLGDVDTNNPQCPEVYRKPVGFFQATYVTRSLDELLGDVTNVLAGGAGNRVLQLRTPFGGGKTHTLIALLHLCRSRSDLRAAGLAAHYADPGPTRVVVLPCLDLNAAGGRMVDGIQVQTLWGELAIRLGGLEAYAHVATPDRQRVNPGGDLLRTLLDGQPTLILLDEVLTYVEAALGVTVADTTLGRQTMLFLQHLTEVVRGLPHCAMVYSLQQSVREAVGDEGLLDMLDRLVSRVDAKKEPVSGDEVLRVVQRRLFQALGDERVREAVAREYADQLRGFLVGQAQSEAEKKGAADQAETLRTRILEAYPFHPELLDLMYHRWGSLPSYQRTRGALQFLATVVGALWKSGDGGPLIGPGDVPLDDPQVRNAFFSQVGEREAMTSVLSADLLGKSARCTKVDDAIGSELPNYQPLKVGTRLTRALTLYSFGAKPGEDRGVYRAELVAGVALPGLPADVLDVALQQLTDTLLYIHSTGRRFRFEKRPNLNKLIDTELGKVEKNETLDEIRRVFLAKLDAKAGFVVWPDDSGKIKDRSPRFQVVFMGLDHALDADDSRQKLVLDWAQNCGGNKRVYRNALAFALPSASESDKARDAARRVLAIDTLLRTHKLEAEEKSELQSRLMRARDELLAATRRIYTTVLLPVAAPRDAQDPIALERFEVQGYQALGAGVLESIHGILENWVFKTVVPAKLVASVHLGSGDVGSPGHWITGTELVDQVFGSVQFPKLLTLEGLKEAVALGVSRGVFGYVMGANCEDGSFKLDSQDALSLGVQVTRDDIDLSEGSFLVSKALADSLKVPPPLREQRVVVEPDATRREITVEPAVQNRPPPQVGPTSPALHPRLAEDRQLILLHIRPDRKQVFQVFDVLTAISDLADKEMTVRMEIRGVSSSPLDPDRYDMSVLLPLEELGIEILKS